MARPRLKRKTELSTTPTTPTKPRTLAASFAQITAALGLGVDWQPKSDIQSVLKQANIPLRDTLTFLRNSSREEAKKVVFLADGLSPNELKSVTIDQLLASAEIDPTTMLEVITGAIHAQGASIATMIAAVAHPQVMKKTILFAKQPEGFNDRRLLHQGMGTVPVPKSTISNVTISGNRISNTQINANVPRLEDVTRVVDAALEAM